MHGWRIGGIAAAVSIAVAFPGCMAMHERVGKWLATPTPAVAPTPTPRAKSAAAAPRVYFAATEGVKVYSKPSASSNLVGELSLHEKVTRFKREEGFAYVESATSGLKGWVDNSQLIWRLPSGPSTTAPPPSEPEPEAPAAPAAEEPPAPEAATPETAAPPAVEALTPTPTSVPAVAPPRPKATPGGVAPSIFNPY